MTVDDVQASGALSKVLMVRMNQSPKPPIRVSLIDTATIAVRIGEDFRVDRVVDRGRAGTVGGLIGVGLVESADGSRISTKETMTEKKRGAQSVTTVIQQRLRTIRA